MFTNVNIPYVGVDAGGWSGIQVVLKVCGSSLLTALYFLKILFTYF